MNPLTVMHANAYLLACYATGVRVIRLSSHLYLPKAIPTWLTTALIGCEERGAVNLTVTTINEAGRALVFTSTIY